MKPRPNLTRRNQKENNTNKVLIVAMRSSLVKPPNDNGNDDDDDGDDDDDDGGGVDKVFKVCYAQTLIIVPNRRRGYVIKTLHFKQEVQKSNSVTCVHSLLL